MSRSATARSRSRHRSTDLVPRTIAGTIPQLSLLQALDLPVDGNANVELTSDGDVRTATLNLGIGHGSLRLPALPEAPLEVDGGSLNVAYDGVAEKITLAPSTLSWRGSRITISGGAAQEKGDASIPHGPIDLRASEGCVRRRGVQRARGSARRAGTPTAASCRTAARSSWPNSSCAPAAPRSRYRAISSPARSPRARGSKARSARCRSTR